MHAKIMKRWDAVKPGDVYHTTFQPGDEVDGALAKLAIECKVAEPTSGTKAVAPPSTVRGKVKPGVEGFAAGAIVEGEEAQRLIAEGKATLVKDKGAGPSETKA